MMITENERRRIRLAAECILKDFIWNDTSQGERYWSDVHRNLRDLANSEITETKKKKKSKKKK